MHFDFCVKGLNLVKASNFFLARCWNLKLYQVIWATKLYNSAVLRHLERHEVVKLSSQSQNGDEAKEPRRKLKEKETEAEKDVGGSLR